MNDEDDYGEAPSPRSQNRPTIDFQRRLQLHGLAVRITQLMLEETKPHERGLLNSMVSDLLPREE